MPQRFDFLVLGGGVAGLSFALEAARRGLGGGAHQAQPLREQHHVRAGGSGRGPLGPGQLRAAHRGHAGRRGGPEQPRGGGGHRPRGPGAHPRAGGAGRTFRYPAPTASSTSAARAGTPAGASCTPGTSPAGRSSGRCSPPATTARTSSSSPTRAAIDLILDRRSPHGQPRCLGAYVLLPTGEIETVLGKVTVLATGGAGKVYLYTTNPDVATGDGVAMAYRAGARDRQHGVLPVPPHLPLQPGGEDLPHLRGAARRGRHAAAAQRRARSWSATTRASELAPRDIVARAIDAELKRTGDDYVLLDMTHLGRGVPRRALPEHLRDLQGVRHRHGGAAHPGRARGALPVRRRGRPTSAAAPRVPGLLRDRRGGAHRAARRQPAGLQLAARGPGLRPPRGAAAAEELVGDGRRARTCRRGTRARRWTRTRRSSSPTTGTRSAA